MKEGYKTRQQSYIIDYLASAGSSTVSQIAAYFKEKGIKVGLTTIYRQLEKLQQQGLVQKHVTDGGGACFQYLKEDCEPSPHFHLKCLDCGCLLHMECPEIARLTGHISARHDFEIQTKQTTFYGYCRLCRTKHHRNQG